MNNNTEVVFENIEQRILKEIKEAHYAIFVSVAWFTNKQLFQALLEKAKENCYISIIIQFDDINSQCGIDYSQIQVGRSECFMISKDEELLHDKFCVIDFRKVITGSYNWTYKASQNSENVVIISDPTIATQYITRFEQQKAKYNDINVQSKLSPKISINKEISTTSQNSTDNTSTPIVSKSIRKCYNCQNELNHDKAFCQYCGRQQKDSNIKITRIRKCSKCGATQTEPLLDMVKTHYCTNCGESLFVGLPLPIGFKIDTTLIRSCKICNTINDKYGNYCPGCGVKREVSSSHGFLYSRDEYKRDFKEYQLCPKCSTPNYFEKKYCRNCGENLTLHAKDSRNHGWIDLGLSVLWSTRTMPGFWHWMHSKKFQWENEDNYKFNDGIDAASIEWGNKWRLPTKEEFIELLEKCEWEKIVRPDKSISNALKVTGPNGNHIILPTTGHKGYGVDSESAHRECWFWTSTKKIGKFEEAYCFRYNGYEISTCGERIKNQQERIELWLKHPLIKEHLIEYFEFSTMDTFEGLAIRPVADKKWQGKL